MKRPLSQVEPTLELTRIEGTVFDFNQSSMLSKSHMPAKRISKMANLEGEKREIAPQSQMPWDWDTASRQSSYSPMPPSIPLAERPLSRQFAADASVVLIGFRGSGKSTLALMACSNLGLRLVDADDYWETVTGQSKADHRKNHSNAEHQLREILVLETMLEENRAGCVIAGGSGCVERWGQSLFKEYAKTHPIIYVHRELEAIQEYLQIKDEKQIARLLSISKPWYLACSNFEFFNVTEPTVSDDVNFDASLTPTSSFLTLKRTEQIFLRFLSRIHNTNKSITSRAGMHNLAASPLESRPYTYVLTIPKTLIPEEVIGDDFLKTSLDAYELKIDLKDSGLGDESSALSNVIRDSISKRFAFIRRHSAVPLIYHVELDPVCAENSLYLDLLHHGLRLSPDYLSVDLRCNKEVFQSIRNACGSTKILGHYEDHEPVEDGWNSKHRFDKYLAACDMGCDLVRLIQCAISADDNLGVQQFHGKIKALSKPHPPLIAYNTGRLGRTSNILNPLLTPVIQPGLPHHNRLAASTLITAAEAQKALYAMFVLHPMHFCVIGTNISHSLAPAMHSAACRAWGIPHEWTPLEGSSLSVLNELVNNPGFGGAMISLPYKSEIISHLHSVSLAAAAIGAVNTVIPLRFEPDPDLPSHLDQRFWRYQTGPIKALYGDNTDWIGFHDCICRSLSPANVIRSGTAGLVVGAGGMARAAIYAMLQVGIRHIVIHNRTLKKAEQVAEHFNVNFGFRKPALDVVTPTESASGKARKVDIGVMVLQSRQDPWPAGLHFPTVIVSTLPIYGTGNDAAPDFLLPEQWLGSSTGGAFIEVGTNPSSAILGIQRMTQPRN